MITTNQAGAPAGNNGKKTGAIIMIAVLGLLMVGALFAWRYWGELKGLFSKADVGYDISLYPAGQSAPFPLQPCPTIANGTFQTTLTVFNNGTGNVSVNGAAYHGVSPQGPAVGQPVDRNFYLPSPQVIPSGGSISMPVTFTGIPNATVTNLVELIYLDADENSSPGNWTNSQEDDDIRYSCSGDVGGGNVPPGSNGFDLAVAKSANPSTVQVGQNTTFTVTVLNQTAQIATNVVYKDNLPTTVSYVSHQTASGTYTPASGDWSIPSIPANGSVKLDLVVKVNSAGVHTNVVNLISSTPPDTNQSNNSASASVSTTGNPPGGDLVCSPATQTVAINQNATFAVTNGQPTSSTWSAPGGTPATGSGASFTTKYATAGDKVVTVSFQNSTGQCRVTVTAAAYPTPYPTPYPSPYPTPYPSPYPTPYPTPAATNADLSLSKSVSNPTPQTGSDIIYSITVTNSGPAVATGVTVKDDLPGSVSYKSSSATQGSYDQPNDTWTVGTLQVGQSANLLITVNVTQTGTITNIAQVCASSQPDPDSTPCNNISSEDDQASATINPTTPYPYPTPVQNNADLSLTKSVSNPNPLLGSNIVYSITVYNSGPLSAGNVTVKDILPAGVSYVTSSASVGNYSSGTGIWTVGTLNVGTSANLQLTAKVDTLGSKTNIAEVCSSSQPDPDSTPCNNNSNEDDQGSATITPNQNPPSEPTTADLSLVKSVSNNTPRQNGTVIYSITVFNSGPAVANNVTVRELIPGGLSFVSSLSSQGSYISGTGIWTVGTLNVGSSANLQITATVTGNGTIINVAEVCSSSQPDPDSTPCNNNPSEDDYDTETITPALDQFADLALTKGVSNEKPKVGEQVVYSIYVANNGPQGATNVTVKDLLPSGLTFVSAKATVGSYSKDTSVWTIGDLAVNSTVALQITVKVTTVGTISNTAQVCSASPQDPDSTPCNNNPNEDDQGTVSLTSVPGDILPAAGASTTTQVAFGSSVVILASFIFFAGRSRKFRTKAGSVSVTTFDKY